MILRVNRKARTRVEQGEMNSAKVMYEWVFSPIYYVQSPKPHQVPIPFRALSDRCFMHLSSPKQP